MKIQHFSLIILAVALLASCSGNQFKVDGTITGAADTTAMVLEVSSNGMWYIVDSVKPDNDGSFAVTSQAPEFPNIYRLRIADQAIYFPIDSLDHITVKAGLKEFGTNYTLSGSEHAEQVMKIDREAMQLAGGKGSPEQIKAWKHRLAQQIVSDPGGIVAYYAINKFIDGVPVFDPLNDEDLRIVGAVANAFNNFHPNDPRTDYLVDVLLQGQKRRRMAAREPSDTMFVTETSLLDIKLQDYNGKTHQLQDVAAHNRVVLLNFTMYEAEFSPVYNKLLNDLYTKYKNNGLAIYQVSLDPDNVAWRQAAQNLPWITVFDPMSTQSANVGNYQVSGVPTTFIIKNGDVVERVEDGLQLEAAVDRPARLMAGNCLLLRTSHSRRASMSPGTVGSTLTTGRLWRSPINS